jgi:hypothetical protein
MKLRHFILTLVVSVLAAPAVAGELQDDLIARRTAIMQRLAPEDMQDRLGWLGEGLTDKKYLDTHSIPGVKMLKFEKILDRKDII